MLVPAAVALFLGLWWRRMGRAVWSSRWGAKAGSKAFGRGRFSVVRQSLRDGRMAAFAEILSLLVKQRVPLQEAVVLAAETNPDRAIRDASQQIADRLRRGDVVLRRGDLPPQFPPLLGWLLVTGMQQPDLGQMLSRTAASYRERAARTTTWTAVYLPIALTVLLGGTATLVEGLFTFVPIWKMLYDVGMPS
jgi:type II secretory pathway component PulF